MSNNQLRMVLALDLGTTSTKLAVYDSIHRQVVHQSSREVPHFLSGCNEHSSVQNECDVPKVVNNIHLLVSAIPAHCQTHIGHIIVSGQMHGLVLWKCEFSNAPYDQGDQPQIHRNDASMNKREVIRMPLQHCPWRKSVQGRFEVNGNVSPFFTWMDQRCSEEFLSSLPKPKSGQISSGFGCATLFWLLRHQPEFLENYNCAGTIVDFVVAMLCNSGKPTMSYQMAHSWGYFDRENNAWEIDKLKEAGFPIHLLPDLVEPGVCIGQLMDTWTHISGDALVYVGLGDLQCSVYPFLKQSLTTAAMNISTSAQVVYRCPTSSLCSSTKSDEHCSHCGVEFPYFSSTENIMVIASLNAGNVLSRFVKMLQSWLHDLTMAGLQESQIWNRLELLSQNQSSSADEALEIIPTLFGERHNPEQRASVNNVRAQNVTLGSVYVSLCSSLVKNLAEMANLKHLKNLGVQKIACSGSTLRRNATIQQAVRSIFHEFELEFASEESACIGAAEYVCDHILTSIV